MSDVIKIPELASYMFIIWNANIRCRAPENSFKDFSMCEKRPSIKKEPGLYKYLSFSIDIKAYGDTWMPIWFAYMYGSPLCPDIKLDMYYFPLFAPKHSTSVWSVSFIPHAFGEESRMKTIMESWWQFVSSHLQQCIGPWIKSISSPFWICSFLCCMKISSWIFHEG